jgi:hypothetical protein
VARTDGLESRDRVGQGEGPVDDGSDPAGRSHPGEGGEVVAVRLGDERRECLTAEGTHCHGSQARTNPGPAALRYYDAVIGSFRTAGFPIALAAHAVSAIDASVCGFGLQELSPPFDEMPVEENSQAVLEALPLDEYPYLTEMIVDHALQPGYDFGAEFTWGLDLILDAFERLQHPAQPSAHRFA